MSTRRTFIQQSTQVVGAIAATATATHAVEQSSTQSSKRQKILMRSSWGQMSPLAHLSCSIMRSHSPTLVTTYRFFSPQTPLTSCASERSTPSSRSDGPHWAKRSAASSRRTYLCFLEAPAPVPVGLRTQIWQIGMQSGSPTVFVSLVEWADKVISE